MATVFDGTTYIPVFGNDIVLTVTTGGASITALVVSASYTDNPPLTEIKNGSGDVSMRVWSDTDKSKRLSLELVVYAGSQALAGDATEGIPDAGGGITIASADKLTEGAGTWKVLSKSIKATNSDVQSVSLELAPAL